jgi:hypothetical protein
VREELLGRNHQLISCCIEREADRTRQGNKTTDQDANRELAEQLTGNGDFVSLSAESGGGEELSSGMLIDRDLSSGLEGVLGVLGT